MTDLPTLLTSNPVLEVQLDPNLWLSSNLKAGDMVWVHSDEFEVECLAYAVNLHEYSVTVRIDLPEDHPSMMEVISETGQSYEETEIYDTIPFEKIECIRYFDKPDAKLRVWKRTISSAERARRAKRSGSERPAMPELDLGLRTQAKR